MTTVYICNCCYKEIDGKIIELRGEHYCENCWRDTKRAKESELRENGK